MCARSQSYGTEVPFQRLKRAHLACTYILIVHNTTRLKGSSSWPLRLRRIQQFLQGHSAVYDVTNPYVTCIYIHSMSNTP